MANFLTRAFGGVEHFFGFGGNNQQKKQQPLAPPTPPTINFQNLNQNQSLRQQALPASQQQPQPQQQSRSLVPVAVQKPQPAPQPQNQPLVPPLANPQASPFINNMVHGGLQVPQGATKTYHDQNGNVTGWEDHQGSHLTPLGQQQMQGGTHPENILAKAGNLLFPNTERFVNTVGALGSGIGSLVKASAGAITHNKVAEANALAGADPGMNRFLEQGHGAGGQGGLFKNAQEAGTATPGEIARKSVGGGLGVGSEVLPFIVGAGEVGAGAKVGSQAVRAGKVMGTGGVIAGTGNVGQQLSQNGKVDPAEAFRSFLAGAGTAGVVHGASEIANGFVQKGLNTARQELAGHLATNPDLAAAYQNHLAGQALKQQIAQHLATNPVALNNALNHTAENVIAALPGVAGNEAAVASIHTNPALGDVLHHAVQGDETSLEHSLRQLLPGADEATIQQVKGNLTGKNGLVTEPTPQAKTLQDQKIASDQESVKAQQEAQAAQEKATADQATAEAESQAKAATDPRAVTPEEVQTLANATKNTDVVQLLKSANPDLTHNQVVKIAHDVTALDDPKDVADYLNSKGILADSGADQATAKGAPVLSQEQQALADANKTSNADVPAGEKAIQQDAPIAGDQPQHAAIAQNAAVVKTNAKDAVDHSVADAAATVAARERAAGTVPMTEAERVDAAHASVQAREALANPTTGKEAPNTTYTERLAKDTSIPLEARQAITNISHSVHDDNALISNTKNWVSSDIASARQAFDEGILAKENPDAHIHLGNALVDKYNAAGDSKAAGAVYNDLIRTATRTGQAFRALQAISKISPQSIVKYAKAVASSKGKTLSPELQQILETESKRIAKLPDGEEKAAAIIAMKTMADQPTFKDKAGEWVEDILSIPRALMATADDSFPGRQGAVLGSRHPVVFVRSIKNGIKMAFDENYFNKRMGEIADNVDKNGAAMKPMYKRMGVDLPAVFDKREEQFGDRANRILEGKLARKLVFGRVVAAADRAYSGTAVELRSGVVDDFVNKMGGVKALQEGGEVKTALGTKKFAAWTTKDYKDYGRVIDTASGRGHGGDNVVGNTFEKMAPTLSKTLFSARLWKSRLDLLNPVYYATLAPAARKEALQSSLAFASLVGVTLSAASAAGAEVELDPRSSDFGKIKIGNTRYDIMGGLQQNIVLATREITGEKKKSDGTVVKLDGNAFHGNRATTLGDFVTNKETPVLSTGTRILAGKDQGGNPVNPWTEAAKLFIPLGAQDVYSAVADQADKHGGNLTPKDVAIGVAEATPGFGGAGVQTYKSAGNGNLQAGKVDPSTLSPKDLTKYEKNVVTSFTDSLNPADKTNYDLLKNKDAATFAIRKGKVTQDQLDALQVRENQAKDAAGLPITYIKGITDQQYQGFDPATQAVVKQASLQGAGKFGKANITPESQKLIETAAQNAWPGIGTIKPTNKMALNYVQLEKNVADAPGDQAKQFEAVKGFWKSVVKDQYSDPIAQMYEDGNPNTTNETSKGYGFSVKDIERLASGVTLNGKRYTLTKPDMNSMIELDNRLLESGLIDSPKFSNKVRGALGYGDAPGSKFNFGYSGGKGSGSSKANVDTHASSFITSNGSGGSGGGSGGSFLNLIPKATQAPKLDLAKFKAPTGKPARIRINL